MFIDIPLMALTRSGLYTIGYGALILGIVIFVARYLLLWAKCLSSGAHVTVANLVGMNIRQVPQKLIIDSLIKMHNAGIKIPVSFLEQHYLAGGQLHTLTKAAIITEQSGLGVSYEKIAACILSDGDPLGAIRDMQEAKSKGKPLSFAEAVEKLRFAKSENIRQTKKTIAKVIER